MRPWQYILPIFGDRGLDHTRRVTGDTVYITTGDRVGRIGGGADICGGRVGGSGEWSEPSMRSGSRGNSFVNDVRQVNAGTSSSS